MLNKLLILTLLIFATGCSLTPEDSFSTTKPVPATNTENLPQNKTKTPAITVSKVTEDPKIKLESPTPVIQQPNETCQAILVENRKKVIGEVEYIGLVREKVGYDARIDTGATTSSLGVYNIIEFERDGKKWVKFSLNKKPENNTIKAKTQATAQAPQIKVYEYPIARVSQIKSHGTKKSVRRPVIEMLMSLGDKNYNAEFSLADRSQMTYKILIGREFLRDRVIVDVSHKHMIQGK